MLLAVLAACGDDAVDPMDGGGRDSGPGGDSGIEPRDSGGGGSDGGGGGDAGADASVPEGTVPMFVAVGMVGRSTISCDDGRSWVGNRSWDQVADPHLCGSTEPIFCDRDGSSCMQRWYDGSCGSSSPCDCGHSPGFGKGVAFGNGVIVATWGWGWPGAVRVSRNGVDWETTHDNEQFGGIAFGAGRFVVAARDNYWSEDGMTWTPGETADFSGPSEPVIWSVRRFGFADHDGGRFIATASGNTDRDTLLSSDGGETWWRPSDLPPGCGAGVGSYGGIVYGNGVIVMIGEGSACRSLDGGDTWSLTRFIERDEETIVANPIFTGTEFLAWSHYDHVLYRSTDGARWEGTPMTTPRSLGAVARSPVTGTFVAVDSVWSGYENQRFLRSADGLSWEELPAGAFTPGHPIFHIEFGHAEPSAECPAP